MVQNKRFMAIKGGKMKTPNPFNRNSGKHNKACQFLPQKNPDGFNVVSGIRFTSMDQIRNMILKFNPNLEEK